MNKVSNYIWGLLLVVLGVILGLNALEITHINIFFEGWWTLFIILPAFFGLLKEKDKTGNLIFLVVGIFLLLSARGLLDFSVVWKLILPTILVVIGLSYLFKDIFYSKVKEKIKELDKTSDEQIDAVFSSKRINLNDDDFKGASLNSVFGGLDLDLRNCKIKKDVVIEASAIFGGIDLYLPEDVNVKIVSTSIFGGIEDKKTRKESSKKDVVVYLKATCIFGGVNIK